MTNKEINENQNNTIFKSKIQKNIFIVVIPNIIEDKNKGFRIYSGTKQILCKAVSISHVYKIYPDAIAIQKV